MWAKEKITGLNQRQKLAKKILTKARAKLQFVVQKSIKSSMAKKMGDKCIKCARSTGIKNILNFQHNFYRLQLKYPFI